MLIRLISRYLQWGFQCRSALSLRHKKLQYDSLELILVMAVGNPRKLLSTWLWSRAGLSRLDENEMEEVV